MVVVETVISPDAGAAGATGSDGAVGVTKETKSDPPENLALKSPLWNLC